MKTKKMVVMVLAAVLVVAFAATGAFAAFAWYDATVTASAPGYGGAGPSGATDTIFVLTHSATTKLFTNKQFKAWTGRQKEMLAVALTAMANGKKLRVYVDLAAAAPPPIQIMMLLP